MEKFNFLICGGAGFIGSNISDFLIEMGHSVTVIDNLSTGKLSNVNPKAKFIELDLSNSKIDVDGYDYIIHMAATPNVQQSIDDPETSHKNNFITTLNILNSCIGKNIKKIIFSSTSAIYGNPIKFPTSEDFTPNPMSPYALDKLNGEQYFKLYSELYNIKSVCLRYFNVFGDRMTNEGSYKSVISVFKEQYNNNLPLTITNDGNQRRDFINVKDVVSAYSNILTYGERVNNIPSFNISSGERYSTLEVFNIVQDVIGKKIRHEIVASDGFEIKKQFMNSSLLQEKTGWKSEHTMKDTMKEIVDFYMESK
jgi:UDP-glucose 4-epimerase